jgi:cytochrome c biogenesis protein CcdA/thiol-disulfide isomerase/thioredoxin
MRTMQESLINVGLAFMEGLALIVSPCILPVLPIILSGSVTGKKARPFGIVAGFILTFALFTLFSRTLIYFTKINMNTVRDISIGILLLIGIIMMSETLTEKLNRLLQPIGNMGNSLTSVNDPQGGFYSGMLFGGLVGILWTPCAGPVLAAVIVQVVLQKTTFNSMLVVLAFAIGAGIPMLLIALFGRSIMTNITFIRTRASFLRKLMGFILVLAVLYFMFLQGFTLLFNQKSGISLSRNALINGIEQPYEAPEIGGITAWINSPPLTISELKGKVILIDFWTYSCINCLRTLPYLKDWYAKYHDKGFEIIGVHSPEFQFEHDLENVEKAVKAYDILYPVALDNDFVTWRHFQNEYWPAHFLINQEGKVVYAHFGEGEYDVTENNIRFLLGMNAADTDNKPDENYSIYLTPETYLGYYRAERFASPSGMTKDALAFYGYPETLAVNHWALTGSWIISREKIVSVSPNAAIKLHFRADKVYMVMGMTTKPVTVTLLLNGEPLVENGGSDVKDGKIVVDQNKLYSILDLAEGNEGTLEIIAETPGLEVYSFTFGG